MFPQIYDFSKTNIKLFNNSKSDKAALKMNISPTLVLNVFAVGTRDERWRNPRFPPTNRVVSSGLPRPTSWRNNVHNAITQPPPPQVTVGTVPLLTIIYFFTLSTAIHEFPDDLFTNNERKTGAVMLHIVAVRGLTESILSLTYCTVSVLPWRWHQFVPLVCI